MLHHRIILFIASALLVSCTSTPAETPPVQSAQQATVTSIVDGDTIHVLVDKTPDIVRFIGIDTPELHGKNDQPECYALAATDRLRNMIDGKTVTLIAKPDEDRDDYDRLLRYVHHGDTDIGKVLLRDGYAEDFPWFPHPRLEEYREAEAEAHSEGRGLWGMCQ